jgi:FtsP/CotA-like multicopper oxidase with cupredoxin domain
LGSVEIWNLINDGGAWSHPIHIHFEEGQILSRDGAAPPVWEQWARKDVYRIGVEPNSTNQVQVAIRFREFAGTYMEHCHNTQHEDHAMLMRWDIRNPGATVLIPTPRQTWEGTFYEPSFTLSTAN